MHKRKIHILHIENKIWKKVKKYLNPCNKEVEGKKEVKIYRVISYDILPIS